MFLVTMATIVMVTTVWLFFRPLGPKAHLLTKSCEDWPVNTRENMRWTFALYIDNEINMGLNFLRSPTCCYCQCMPKVQVYRILHVYRRSKIIIINICIQCIKGRNSNFLFLYTNLLPPMVFIGLPIMQTPSRN